jgi:hypothetical protein
VAESSAGPESEAGRAVAGLRRVIERHRP